MVLPQWTQAWMRTACLWRYHLCPPELWSSVLLSLLYHTIEFLELGSITLVSWCASRYRNAHTCRTASLFSSGSCISSHSSFTCLPPFGRRISTMLLSSTILKSSFCTKTQERRPIAWEIHAGCGSSCPGHTLGIQNSMSKHLSFGASLHHRMRRTRNGNLVSERPATRDRKIMGLMSLSSNCTRSEDLTWEVCCSWLIIVICTPWSVRPVRPCCWTSCAPLHTRTNY